MVNSLEQFSMILPMPLAAWIVIAYLKKDVRKDFNVVGLLFLHITSFLSGRRARIKIGELIGDRLESELGTSAGTWLGSLLFILHLHDVHSCIKPKFAEDLIAVSVGNTV